MAKLTKNAKMIGLCSMANFINSADRVIMPIAIIQMSSQFGWSLHDQGWILSAFSIGYMSSMLIGGSAAKRYSGKGVLLLAVLLWSFTILSTPFVSHSLPLLLLNRVLLGFGEGIGLPTIFHMFAHVLPMEERSRAFGYLIALGSVGQTFATLLCPHMDWQWSFYIFGVMGLVWCVVWMVVYVEVRPVDQEFVQPPKLPSISWRDFISGWGLWSIYIAHFSMNWSNYVILQWLPTYITTYLSAGKHHLMLTCLPYIMNSLVSVGAGHFADALIKRKWTLLSTRRLMTVVGLVGPGIFLIFFSAVHSLPLAIFFVTFSMGLSACNSAGHLSNHADVAPNHAGITFAVSNLIATIPGIFCGPLTAHLVVQSQHRWFPVFVIAAAVNFVGAVVYQSQSAAHPIL